MVMAEKKYDAFQQMLSVLDIAAERLGYIRDDYEALRHPERELTVSIPVEMDNGKTHVFTGYRIQYSSARGPLQGWNPVPSGRQFKRGQGADCMDGMEMCGGQYFLWRCEGWRCGGSRQAFFWRAEQTYAKVYNTDFTNTGAGKRYSGA